MNVDVGVVEYNTKDADGKKIRKQLEVDFVVNQGGKRVYSRPGQKGAGD